MFSCLFVVDDVVVVLVVAVVYVIGVVVVCFAYLLVDGHRSNRQHVLKKLICKNKCTCCHTEKAAADSTCHPMQSQYAEFGSAIPNTDPIPSGIWQGRYYIGHGEGASMDWQGRYYIGHGEGASMDWQGRHYSVHGLAGEVLQCSW